MEGKVEIKKTKIPCGTPFCAVCERALFMYAPENANWRKLVKESTKQAQSRTVTRGSFSLETIRNLPQYVPEVKESSYIYDPTKGKKRRHDPWFKQHAAKAKSKETAPEVEKNTKAPKKKQKPREIPNTHSDGTKPMNKDPAKVWVDSIFA